MRIVGMLQARNEVSTGHLDRFIRWMLPILDSLYVYDDASDDQTPKVLEEVGANVLRSPVRTFSSELLAKNLLLDHLSALEPEGTWILRVDADEVLFADRGELEEFCRMVERLGFDSSTLPTVNLWKSSFHERVDDHFSDFAPVRLWKHSKSIRFPSTHGLHVTSDPVGLRATRTSEELAVIHFGFAEQQLVLQKCAAYASFGQSGYALNRLLIDAQAKIRDTSHRGPQLGTRWPNFVHEQSNLESGSIAKTSQVETMLDFNQLLVDDAPPPKVSVFSLIFASVEWLEMQYAEMLKLAGEFPAGEVEVFFVANDPTPDVLEFLRANAIPHYLFRGRKKPDEWYINSVYRAYNFGVSVAAAERVVMVNSDMIYGPGFLKELLRRYNRDSFVAGRLIESGRLKSGLHGIEKDFGSSPRNFQRNRFMRFAATVSAQEELEGGLYMPLLVSKHRFMDLGGFPEGNLRASSLTDYLKAGGVEIASPGEEIVPGDQAFFRKAQLSGVQHITVASALAYHFQEGELQASRRTNLFKRKIASGVWISNDSLDGINGEPVLWSRLAALLENNSMAIGRIQVGRASSKLFELMKPLQLSAVLSISKIRGGRPRVLLRNATYTVPVNVGLRNISLLQDNVSALHLKYLQKLTLAKSSLIVTNDLDRFVEAQGRKMKWIPVPLDNFWTDSPFIEDVVQGGRKRGIFVGALNEVKGWSLVSALVKSNGEIDWTIISKYSSDKLPKDLQALGNITFRTSLNQEQLLEELQGSSFLLCASPKETQHLASLEALSRGVRVITTPTGLLGQHGPGSYWFGSVVPHVSDDLVRSALQEPFSPQQASSQVRKISETSTRVWVASIKAELEASFTLAGSSRGFLAFIQRLNSAWKDISRKLKRKILSHLIEIRARLDRR